MESQQQGKRKAEGNEGISLEGKKAKAKSKSNRKGGRKGVGVERVTIRDDWDGCGGVWYYHLRMLISPPLPPSSSSSASYPDILTWRTHLTTSLHRLLGIQGTTLTIDILKLHEYDCWVRVSGVSGVGVRGGQAGGGGAGALGTAVSGYVGVYGDAVGDATERSVGMRVVKAGKGWCVGLVGAGEEDLWG